MQFNPSTPALVGLEFAPTRVGSVVLDALTKCACQSMVQTAGQAIIGVRWAVGAIPGRGGLYVCEVYDNEDAVEAAPSVLYAYPNEDVSGVGTTQGLWQRYLNATTPIYNHIAETSAPGAYDANYIAVVKPFQIATPISTTNTYKFRFGTGGLALNGKRILGVRVNVYAARSGIGSEQRIKFGLTLGGVEFDVIPAFYPEQYGKTLVRRQSAIMQVNPSTGLPWTIADVQALDTTDNCYVSAAGKTTQIIYVNRVFLEVFTTTETRLAVGALDDRASALVPNAWNTATVLTPTGGAWTKDGAGRHLYTLRRVSSAGSLVVPSLVPPSDEAPSARSFTPTLDPTYFYVTAMGSAQRQVFGVQQLLAGPTASVDSQPYAAQVEARVYTGRNAEGELSGLTNANQYIETVILVKPNGATANLVVKIRNRTDAVYVGDTVNVTPAEVAALPDSGNGWKILDVRQPTGFTGNNAKQYAIECSSAATGTGTDYWSVLAVDTLDEANAAGFGGTTDVATINGAEANRYDLVGVLSSVPTAPANFAAAVQTLHLPDYTSVDCDGAHIFSVEYAHLSWTATALGGNFMAYEVQRSDDGVAWEQIATIWTEATHTLDDYESRRGVTTSYRLRVFRSDGAAGAWSATVTAKCEPIAHEWIFTSNFDPTLTVAYNQAGSEIEFDDLDSDEVVFQRIYQRDGQVAFLGTERRGVSFPIPVVVHAETEPANTREGIEVLDALRAIAHADLPYVCVLDHRGNRFYAKVQVPNWSQSEPERLYLAQTRVTELQFEPTALVV